MHGRHEWLLAALVVASVIAGCGGGDSSVDTASTTEGTSGSTENTSADTAEPPTFADDFGRVCASEVGFPGVTPLTDGPGPHVVAYMENYRDEGDYIVSSRTLPDGWALVEDTNFEDNSELAAVELVACLDRTATEPTGTECDFDGDGETLTLELTDGTYELTIYEATTAEVVGTVSLQASESECPFIATFDEDDTQLVSQPSDDDIVVALKAFVTPE